jgi:hypothetical protein
VASHGLIEQTPDTGFLGDVGGNRLEPAAETVAGRDDLLKRRAAPPGDYDGPPLGGERVGDGGPDAAPAAGDDGDPTLPE